MSGICGVISLTGRPVSRDVLPSMARTLGHRELRGRDEHAGEGIQAAALLGAPLPRGWASAGVAGSKDGRYLLIADARLDQDDELESMITGSSRVQLDRGAGDRVGNPARLLLSGWLRWGPELVDRLRGDFAFVVADRAERRCLAARDPMAMRPLYYSVVGGEFRFASEIGALTAVAGFSPRLHRSRLVRWLAVENAPAGQTFFEGVHAVPAACIVEADGHRTKVLAGWSPPEPAELRFDRDQDYADELAGLLEQAGRNRVDRNESLSLLLSGGLDSVATAGALAQAVPPPDQPRRSGSISRGGDRDGGVLAISYRYEGFPECDERHISEPLARALGFSTRDVSTDVWNANQLLESHWAVDSPIVGMYRPLQEAAYGIAREEGARRLFSAARGDNMIGGYLWDVEGLVRDRGIREGYVELARYRRAFRTGWRDAVGATLVAAGRHRARAAFLSGFAGSGFQGDSGDALSSYAPAWLTPHARDSAGPAADAPVPAVVDGWTVRRALAERRTMVFDPFTEEGTVQNERIAAQHGVRLEDIWGDRRIVEFVCRIPQHVLNRVDEPKRLTRMAVRGWIPERTRQAAAKILPAEFGLHALRTREEQSFRELTSNMRLAQAGLVDEHHLARVAEDFFGGGEFPSGLWTALTAEAWMRTNDLAL